MEHSIFSSDTMHPDTVSFDVLARVGASAVLPLVAGSG
jgi:hypothetical protein